MASVLVNVQVKTGSGVRAIKQVEGGLRDVGRVGRTALAQVNQSAVATRRSLLGAGTAVAAARAEYPALHQLVHRQDH